MRLSQLFICLIMSAAATEGFTPTFGKQRKHSGSLSRQKNKENMISQSIRSSSTTKIFLADLGQNKDDEFHQKDQASTTAQLLSGIWNMIAQASSLVRGVSSICNYVISLSNSF